MIGTTVGHYRVLEKLGQGGPAPTFAPGKGTGATAWPRRSAVTIEWRGGGSARALVGVRELRRGHAVAKMRSGGR